MPELEQGVDTAQTDVTTDPSIGTKTDTQPGQQQAADKGTPSQDQTQSSEPPAWVRQRLSQATAKARDAEAKYRELEAKLKVRDQQFAALSGIPGADPRKSELDELRNLILEAAPEIGSISNSKADEEIKELKAHLEFLQQRYWGSKATDTLGRIHGRVQEGFGRDTVDETRELVHHAFASWVNSDEERTARYYDGDASLEDDFYALMDKGFFGLVKDAQNGEGRKKVKTLPKTTGGATLVGSNDPDEVALEDRSSRDLMDEAFKTFKQGTGR